MCCSVSNDQGVFVLSKTVICSTRTCTLRPWTNQVAGFPGLQSLGILRENLHHVPLELSFDKYPPDTSVSGT